MALLRVLRNRGRRLGPFPGRPLLVTCALAALWTGCDTPDPRYLPDDYLRRELGLGDDDRVHTVRLTGGPIESADPQLDSVPSGAWVQFVSDDWLVHEVAFAPDSLSAAAHDFLERSGQLASPPLLQRGARFVVSFEGAPPGRYPYVLQGNTTAGAGLIVVTQPGR